MNRFYYSKGEDQTVGPVSEDDLTSLLEEGKIMAATKVRLEGKKKWSTMGELFEIEIIPEEEDPAQSTRDRFYYSKGEGETIGPVSEDDLTSLLEDGKITAATKVRLEGKEKWSTMGELFEIEIIPEEEDPPQFTRDKFYYSKGEGETVGPVSEDDLTSLLEDGKITPATKVRLEGKEKWSTMEELFEIEIIPEEEEPTPKDSLPPKGPSPPTSSPPPKKSPPTPVRREQPVLRVKDQPKQELEYNRPNRSVPVLIGILCLTLGFFGGYFFRNHRLKSEAEATGRNKQAIARDQSIIEKVNIADWKVLRKAGGYQIEATFENETGYSLRSIEGRFVEIVPGREVPEQEIDINFTIKGGLAPGESATIGGTSEEGIQKTQVDTEQSFQVTRLVGPNYQTIARLE